jgi:hypothetical protein
VTTRALASTSGGSSCRNCGVMAAPRLRELVRSRTAPREPGSHPERGVVMTDPTVTTSTITLLVALLVIDRLARR